MRSRRTTARRGAGPRPPSPPYLAGLLRLHQEVRAPVLSPARFRVFLTRRALFAVADDRDAVGLHALRHEVVHRRLRAPLTEREVVLVGAALVGVTLDENEVVRVRLEPGRVGVERARVGRTDVVLVEVEVDVLELGDGFEALHRRPRRLRSTRRWR